MRIHRIRVERFRGLNEQELSFSDRGVTVVEAPNEAGKTSMLHAVHVLLHYRDRSRSQPVRAIQPVGRDVATVVEVEISCGPYRLRCLKQYHRQVRTELQIDAPGREQLTGDAAHERLRQILEQSVDLTLLEALWFRQGDPLRRLALGESRALSDALDKVAGAGAESADDDLLEAARGVHQEYFTQTGKEKASLGELDSRVREAEDEVSRLEGALGALQHDVDRAGAIGARLAELRAHLDELGPRARAYEEELERVRALRGEIERQELAAERARAEVERQKERLAERRRLAAEVEEAEARLTASDDELAAKRAEVERQKERLGEVEARRRALGEAHERARALGRLRAQDRELLETERRLEELRGIRDQVARADDEARKAEEFLAACELSRGRMRAIEDAYDALRRAEAQLEAGAPRAEIEALGACEIDIDGEGVDLRSGARRGVSVSRERVITFADVARVRVAPGASLSELREQREGAAERLRRACAEAGVESREEAREVDEARGRAERIAKGRDARIAELLGRRSREELADEIHRLETWAAGQRARRPAEPELPADPARAREVLERAEADEREAGELAESARAAYAERSAAVEELERELAGLESKRRANAEQLERSRRLLAEAREELADEDLDSRRAEAERARERAGVDLAEARRRLEEAGADRIEALAENARAERDRAEDERQGLERERHGVRERLDVRGEQGLGEALARARSRLERARAARDRARKKAEAARLLYQVLREERDRAREAYRAPLKAAIEALGRIVYAPDFEVSLDENLAVAARTLGGETLPWEQLSSGAKEQLALLTGLASARLVGEGGAPLILDDGLGYTDPARLERMGAVLSHAGRECQVIVLTCVADRYRHVGGARVVRLRPQGGPGDRDESATRARAEPEPAE